MRTAALIATALALLAAPAAAELRLSGDARMGLRAETRDGTTRTAPATGLRLEIELSRETDSGLRFGVLWGLSDSRLPAPPRPRRE